MILKNYKLFYKTSNPNEVKRTEPSPSVGIPCLNQYFIFYEGIITMADIYLTMPWSNTIDVVSIRSVSLKAPQH
jgi:hypothetical protein